MSSIMTDQEHAVFKWIDAMERQWVTDYIIDHPKAIVDIVGGFVVIASVEFEHPKPHLRVIRVDIAAEAIALADKLLASDEFAGSGFECIREAFDRALSSISGVG